MEKVRTRFAPSPTGYMHIGNLRTGLYAYLFAKHYKGDFILRIEDTDQSRYVEGAVDVIYSTLKKCGLTHDEGPDVGGNYGPYVQSERKHLYLPYARQLVQKGHAYYCFCQKQDEEEKEYEELEPSEKIYGHHCSCGDLSKEEVEKRLAAGESYVIRQRIPKSGTTTFVDEVFGEVTVENKTLDDQVLIKSDGMPTYNFANVIDDHLMDITHVIRGKEYISSTPKYQLLYEAFDWQPPKNIHVSTILGRNADGSTSKLSKRHGSVSVERLLDEGYLVDAVVNYIAMVGWSPKQEKEIFSHDELIELFDETGIVKTDAIFDYKKLDWVNAQYIKAMSKEGFRAYAEKFLEDAPRFVKEKWVVAAGLAQGRINKFTETGALFEFLENYGNFDLELLANQKNKITKEDSIEILRALLPRFEKVKDWTVENINAVASAYAEEIGKKLGAVMWGPRIAVAGQMITPGGMGEMMYLLGKDESLNRINKTISRL